MQYRAASSLINTHIHFITGGNIMKNRKGFESEQIRNKSFEEIQDSLGNLQKQVYEVIQNNEPVYSEKIAEIMNKYPHTVTPRVLELRELGLIEFAGTSKSKTTGKTVSLWKTAKPPMQTALF